MGSLCCVAARPHGSNMASRDWSMGPHEPCWQTNASILPPPSRWDFRFQPEGFSYGSNDGIQLYRSSTSSNSKESRGSVRGNLLYNHQYSTSGSAGAFLSSPSDLSQGPQWTPPAIQEITLDDYETATRRDQVVGQSSFASIVEGISINADSEVSTSSHSDSSESDPMVKPCLSSDRHFSSRRYFMSKPIHPFSFPTGTTTEASDSAVAGFSDDAATTKRDPYHWSSDSSSNDFVDVSEPFESEIVGRSSIPSDGFKCGLCERFLSQRSPWSSRRIVRSSDMPVAGVLSCQHVFHAECLERTTPKTRKSDPPCPRCDKLEEQNSPESKAFSRLRNGFPKPRPFSEDWSSRPWGCAQVGDCVEGALHPPPRSTMLSLNRSRMKKNLFMKGNSSKEFPGKLRKSGSSLQLSGGKSIDQGAVVCSKTITGPSMKR